MQGTLVVSNMNLTDTAQYGCGIEYTFNGETQSAAPLSTYITVVGTCPELEDPVNGTLTCTGTSASTDRTCTVSNH